MCWIMGLEAAGGRGDKTVRRQKLIFLKERKESTAGSDHTEPQILSSRVRPWRFSCLVAFLFSKYVCVFTYSNTTLTYSAVTPCGVPLAIMECVLLYNLGKRRSVLVCDQIRAGKKHCFVLMHVNKAPLFTLCPGTWLSDSSRECAMLIINGLS